MPEIVGEAVLSPYELAIDQGQRDPETLLTACVAMPETSPLTLDQIEKLTLAMGKTGTEVLLNPHDPQAHQKTLQLAFQVAVAEKSIDSDRVTNWKEWGQTHARATAGLNIGIAVVQSNVLANNLRETYKGHLGITVVRK